MFKIIGAAAAAANLLCEFSIAEKKDAKLINIRNGKVILVRFIAKSIFSLSSENPGAINDTNVGINNWTIKTITKRLINNILSTWLANLLDCFFPFTNYEA